MADGTKIEWTDATWNIVNGCSVLSPGCTNCYAMKLAGTRLKHVDSRKGLTIGTKAGPVWNGITKFNEPVLLDPIRWKRPRKIFVCAHGDLFHDSVPDEWIDKVFAVMALAPQHQFQVLTKRSARMRAYVSSRVALQGNIGGCAVGIALEHGKQVFNGITTTYPAKAAEARELVIDRVHRILPNVWLGVSVEDQKRRERIIDLAETPAAVRWISGEPLLEHLSLTDIPLNGGPDEHGIQWLFNALSGEQYFIDDQGYSCGGDGPDMRPLDWVVAGGESGPGARPMNPAWARALRDQCARAGVPFLFKQWGEYSDFDHIGMAWNSLPDRTRRDQQFLDGKAMIRVGKKAAGRLLDGVEHNGYPS